MNTATAATARTLTRTQLVDRRNFFASLRAGKLSKIGWGPQCLVLAPQASSTIRALCESIEALSDDPTGEFFCAVQFRAEIARCAKRSGAAAPDLHVRLCDALANIGPGREAEVAALVLAAAA